MNTHKLLILIILFPAAKPNQNETNMIFIKQTLPAGRQEITKEDD